MKIVALVPIKLNNERLPGKNLKPFKNGKPLIHYILTTLQKIERCEDIYVYCSDGHVTEYLPDGVKFMQRDPALDRPDCNSMDISKSFCQQIDADIYIYTHATAPFVSADSINKGIDAIIYGGNDSAFAVTKNNAFLWIDGKPNYDLTCPQRTQDMKPFYIESCGFWLFTRELMLQHGRRIGFTPAMILVSAIEALDIDGQIDFDIAEAVYNHILLPNNENLATPQNRIEHLA